MGWAVAGQNMNQLGPQTVHQQSPLEFPANRGKYREFVSSKAIKCAHHRGISSYSCVYRDLFGKSEQGANRELSGRIRDRVRGTGNCRRSRKVGVETRASLRCSTQLSGNRQVSFSRVRFEGCRPLRMASTLSGARKAALQNSAHVTLVQTELLGQSSLTGDRLLAEAIAGRVAPGSVTIESTWHAHAHGTNAYWPEIRSNCAKESKILRVNRPPIEVVVLNCWVTDTNETPRVSRASTILAKSAKLRVRRSTL